MSFKPKIFKYKYFGPGEGGQNRISLNGINFSEYTFGNLFRNIEEKKPLSNSDTINSLKFVIDNENKKYGSETAFFSSSLVATVLSKYRFISPTTFLVPVMIVGLSSLVLYKIKQSYENSFWIYGTLIKYGDRSRRGTRIRYNENLNNDFDHEEYSDLNLIFS